MAGKDYPKPSLTADIAVFRTSGQHWELLLVQRGRPPFQGCWALPGGFAQEGESVEQTAARELFEETGVHGLPLEQVGFYSTPDRDPRGWVVSEAFVAIDDEQRIARAGDDAARAVWFQLVVQDGEADIVQGEDAGGHAEHRLVMRHPAQGDEGVAEELSLAFETQEESISSSFRSANARSGQLAFDHARIIADAWLMVQER